MSRSDRHQDTNIEGNEAADSLADAEAKEPSTPFGLAAQPTVSGIRTIKKAQLATARAAWWNSAKSKLSNWYTQWKLPKTAGNPNKPWRLCMVHSRAVAASGFYFRGKPIPPYAILSHRWGGSEILIEDRLNGNYKEKEEGYQKLRFCANRHPGTATVQYFWIDTCCIDRWDNSERSKAINSMFQWYRNAARCYVFLSDVSLSATADTLQRSDWETSFRKMAVEFFSCEGQRIGNKALLDQPLHDVIDIPLTAPHNCPLEQFSVYERMRWAENRGTTEDEDIIYCLLGVLDVSMPTTYGEGKESALRRLDAEVEGAGSAPSIIPFSRNQSFVGRELQLAELEAKLFSNTQTTTTLAIVGPGGT
ncbi:hypothetical protein KJE20_14341, partial [Pyrenophora tritici-repentis]